MQETGNDIQQVSIQQPENVCMKVGNFYYSPVCFTS